MVLLATPVGRTGGLDEALGGCGGRVAGSGGGLIDWGEPGWAIFLSTIRRAFGLAE